MPSNALVAVPFAPFFGFLENYFQFIFGYLRWSGSMNGIISKRCFHLNKKSHFLSERCFQQTLKIRDKNYSCFRMYLWYVLKQLISSHFSSKFFSKEGISSGEGIAWAVQERVIRFSLSAALSKTRYDRSHTFSKLFHSPQRNLYGINGISQSMSWHSTDRLKVGRVRKSEG